MRTHPTPPAPPFPPCSFQRLQEGRRQLPSWAARDKLVELVRTHQAVVLVGETGSGEWVCARVRAVHGVLLAV